MQFFSTCGDILLGFVALACTIFLLAFIVGAAFALFGVRDESDDDIDEQEGE